MKSHVLRRGLVLAAIAALLATAGHAAAAKGGKVTPATIVFDDLVGDAIQSDGLGAYDGSINRDGSLVVATGRRSLVFDFGWYDGPFAVDDVVITVSSLDAETATVTFEYRWYDFWARGDATDEWRVTMSVSVTQIGDTVHLAPTSDAEIWWREHHRGPFRSDRTAPEWMLADIRDLPWGAVVSR